VLFFVFLLPVFIIGVIPFWFICKKAGFSPWLTLLNIVPFGLGTLVLVYLLAFRRMEADTSIDCCLVARAALPAQGVKPIT
jgi:hypothetical protein